MLELEQTIGKAAPPQSYLKLLDAFNERCQQQGSSKGELLTFNIEDEALTVYNPAPVVIEGQTYLWARVEEKGKEKDSVVRLFKEGKNGVWEVVEGAPIFKRLQDPFYCGVIGGDHVFGGAQSHDVTGTTELGYETVFYRYNKNSFTELANPNGKIGEFFAVGPKKMKCIRLIQIEKGHIGVFTRPQSPPCQFGGRGQIGYFEIASLDDFGKALTEYDQPKNKETLIKGLFIDKDLSDQGLGDEEWGGANELTLLPDGKIEVLGHIASFGVNSLKKNYYPITFIFDPETRSVSDVQIIATAEQFDAVEVKEDDIGSVYYPCGLVKLGNGFAWLYGGIGNSKGGRILIKTHLGDKVGQS